MISASANALAIGSWLSVVARGLLIGFPPVCVPVAWDGVLGKAPAATTAEVELISAPIANTADLYSRVITRATGSFVTDGWLPGYSVGIAGSLANDGRFHVVNSVDPMELALTPSPYPFAIEDPLDEAEAYEVALSGEAPDGFKLCVGPQWLKAWTGGNVCVIVPAELAEVPPMAFQAQPDQLAAHALIVEVHVWGVAPRGAVGIMADIGRYAAAVAIWQEVRRAIQVASRGLGVAIQTAPFQNETEILRYGEALIARLQVASFPVFDARPAPVPSDMSFTVTGSIKPPGV